MARLGPILGRISPPRGGPGEAPGGHFWTFLGRPSRDLKNELLFVVFFAYLGSFFLCYYLPSVVFLAPWLAASCICKKLKIHWFLWVASHMRLVLATPEAINFQGGRVANIDEKRAQTRGPTGPENKVNKRAFLTLKWSQNGPRRLPETCAQDGRQLKRPKMPLGAPQERHQTILERFSSHTGIRGHLISPTWAPGSEQLSKKST